LLGRIARRARELPSRAHPAAGGRSTHALTTRNGGFDAGLRAGRSGHPPDARAVAHQSGKWIGFPPGVDRGLLLAEATSAICFLGALIGLHPTRRWTLRPPVD